MDTGFAGVEGAALAHGITFLYNQAGVILQRRRDRRDRIDSATLPASATSEVETNQSIQLPSAFEANGEIGPEDVAEVDSLAGDLVHARQQVEIQMNSEAPQYPFTAAMVEAIIALRSILEKVYGADLTFDGEVRSTDRVDRVVNNGTSNGVMSGNLTSVVTGDVHDSIVAERLKVNRLNFGTPPKRERR